MIDTELPQVVDIIMTKQTKSIYIFVNKNKSVSFLPILRMLF